MEPLSILSSFLGFFKKTITWVFRKIGYKISKLDEYKDETVEVDYNYADSSPPCIKKKNEGVVFAWSEKYKVGYEKYFEITGDTRRYFKHRNLILWIKKL